MMSNSFASISGFRSTLFPDKPVWSGRSFLSTLLVDPYQSAHVANTELSWT